MIDEEIITSKLAEIDRAIKELEINANRELAFLNGPRAVFTELLQQGQKNEQEKRTEA